MINQSLTGHRRRVKLNPG